jgi:hypothetical protein
VREHNDRITRCTGIYDVNIDATELIRGVDPTNSVARHGEKVDDWSKLRVRAS